MFSLKLHNRNFVTSASKPILAMATRVTLAMTKIKLRTAGADIIQVSMTSAVELEEADTVRAPL
jgi:hypothetical protein